ncbi:hypothetical protein IB276_26330 [Ensifer sp. ENS04]|uniref:hypothetical protein n=1 Tax=Ensifer sp. ENS04 TaxID=2769281 RepID=UPI00177D95D6|nr:hypothetical protein [Ensifer sp. ENS04]MBD9542967.1 hypothetical protein [Ensifer sp. ENS04]
MNPRLIILNTCWAALVVWAILAANAQFVFMSDKSYASFAIALIVIVSAASSFSTGKFLFRAAWLCSALGFLGTLVGIMAGIAGGHDLTSAEGLIAAGANLYAGVGTAFSSTVVGTLGMLWVWTLAQARGDGWEIV